MSEATADESIDEEIDAEEEEESSESSGRFSGKRRLILIAGAAVLLLGGGGAGAYFGGFLDPLLGTEAPEEPVAPQVVFYDLPEMIVNIDSGAKKTFLKIQLSLELDEHQDLTLLNRVLPRIVDQFHVYLRELRADDLHGSAGIYRIKDELLRRVIAAAYPVEVSDVLFKEMLIQ